MMIINKKILTLQYQLLILMGILIISYERLVDVKYFSKTLVSV